MSDLPGLIVSAVARYPFRARGWNEPMEAYLAALIAHVESHDMSVAHELRCGRRQEHWTAEDIAAFRDRCLGSKGPRTEFPPGTWTAIPMMDMGKTHYATVDQAALLDLANGTLEAYMGLRTRARREHVTPILANVLLLDGHVHLTMIADRADRVATVKALIESLPVFGFVVLCDTFMHIVPAEGATPGARPVKLDAVIAHIGAREFRQMVYRPYRYQGSRCVFSTPYPEPVQTLGFDPYAGVFAMRPTTAKVQ